MLFLTIGLFVLAAILGLLAAAALFRQRPVPRPVALAHGAVGAAGLIGLILYAARNPHQLLTVAIVLLVVAALGGAYLFVNDLRRKPGPIFLVVVHALAAVAAVALVVLVALR